MKFVPKTLSRVGHRSLLKLNASSPTLLVVGGVVGLGATAIMAAKATRKIDPVLDHHAKERVHIDSLQLPQKAHQKELFFLYSRTTADLGRVYGPTIAVGTISAVAVLGGHKILRGRHMATMAAYSGLMEQFVAYRARVAKTLGAERERDIYEGAHGEWTEDPEHKGEYKLESKWDKNQTADYLRPWFDEGNVNWVRDAEANRMFLTGVQNHMNTLLEIRGHVLLNDVLDQLQMARCSEGAVAGWVRKGEGEGSEDGYIDFGFMGSRDPDVVAFRNGHEKNVRLNFNIDGPVAHLISQRRRRR